MKQQLPPFARLDGRNALITGSTSGIGRSIALELARAGANVIIHGGRNRSQAQAVAIEAASFGVQSTVQMCDFEHADENIVTLANDTWQWQNGLDILVNNAGADVLTGSRADDGYFEKLSALWQIDVRATILLSRHLGHRMYDNSSGVIINIGWDQAVIGMEGDSGEMFATAKGAIMAFTGSLARTLAPRVRVNCVAPGWIKTAWGEAASDGWQQRAVRESMLQRWGTPDDVAQVVRFLVSDEASFITAQTLHVNGGWQR